MCKVQESPIVETIISDSARKTNMQKDFKTMHEHISRVFARCSIVRLIIVERHGHEEANYHGAPNSMYEVMKSSSW